MNFIDLVFLFSFIGFLFLGFSQGMIRLAIMIVAFYLSLVLASLYFRALGGFFVDRFDSGQNFADFSGFIIVLLVGFGILTAAGLYTFRYVKMPGQLQYVDRIVGVFLGLMLAVMMMGIFALVLSQIRWLDIDFPLAQWFDRSVRSSILLQMFRDYLLPSLYVYLSPILPASSEMIFRVR